MSGKAFGYFKLTTMLCSAALLSGCAQIEWMTDKIGLTRSEIVPAPITAREIVPPAPRRPLGHDVADPEVFQITAPAVWDGRPTFGEVWIAVPKATMPERVLIKNERTGTSIRGGMFAGRPGDNTGPIRLSSTAAAALGVEMGDPVTLTVTALRRTEPQMDPTAPVASNPGNTPEDPLEEDFAPVQDIQLAGEIFEPQISRAEAIPAIEVSEAPRAIATSTASISTRPIAQEGYIEVAQAVSADGADRLILELAEAGIRAEIQEDFVDDQAFWRVFARPANEEPELLLSALTNIQFTVEAEGSDDGTVVAEARDYFTSPEPEGTGLVWVEFGAYPTRNEALAVTQRLSRQNIPSHVCSGKQGLLDIHWVFAGPAGNTTDALPAPERASFCAGVAAAEAARPSPVVRSAMAPSQLAPSPVNAPLLGAGVQPVRIKVGEATGSLKLVQPERITPPHRVMVSGVAVLVPASTPPDLLARIKTALAQIDASQ